MARGGKRVGAGAPKRPQKREKKKRDTVSLLKRDWDALDKIGPSRGRAIAKLLEIHRGTQNA